MSSLSKPFTFTPGTFAVASQVNSDFDIIYGWINGGSAMWADASVAFTNVPSGPAVDPSTANQLTRKSYVDGVGTARLATPQGHTFSGYSGVPSSNSQFYWQSGTTVGTSNGVGALSIAFPFAFPNGLLTLFGNAGDSVANPGGYITFDSSLANRTGFTAGVMKQGSGTYANVSVRVNWLAIGW